MEALTFQQMLEQKPRVMVLEQPWQLPNLQTRQQDRKSNDVASLVNTAECSVKKKPPHEWSVENLRLLEISLCKFILELDGDVRWLEKAAVFFSRVGKYDLDGIFSGETEENLEKLWNGTENSFRYFYGLSANLEPGITEYSQFLKLLKERGDVPKQLLVSFEEHLIKIQNHLDRVNRSHKIICDYELPVFSSMLLAIAKFRELTGEEKTLLLKSAIFHGPIDNPPSVYRKDWYNGNDS